MPYPELCPECGSTFRNTGTHFTARRNEVGRHVLLELGCQNTTRRFWWDFTNGSQTEDGRPSPARRDASSDNVQAVSASNGWVHPETNGRIRLATLEPPDDAGSTLATPQPSAHVESSDDHDQQLQTLEPEPQTEPLASEAAEQPQSADAQAPEAEAVGAVVLAGLPSAAPASLREAFVRQLQLDQLTLRQMRSWLMSDEARRAIEVAAGATEATYERLALILFGIELPHLLGKQSVAPPNTGMSAEERLELQREKARIRARLRRAAAKAARE